MDLHGHLLGFPNSRTESRVNLNILQSAHFEPESLCTVYCASYFSREEDTLSFTVRSGDGLQLQEI